MENPENPMKIDDLGVPLFLVYYGQIIATKPPVGHLKLWFSKGIPPPNPLNSGLGFMVICPGLSYTTLHAYAVVCII